VRGKEKKSEKGTNEKRGLSLSLSLSLSLFFFPAYLALAFSGTKSKMLGLVTNL